MTKRLEGKVALVTGASKGIGAEIAVRLAAEGAAVAVNYSASKEAADRVVAAITGKGGKAVAVHGNLADAGHVKNVVAETVKAFGAIDILVNNAGIYEFAPLDGITPEHFHKHFDLNVLGLLLVSQEAARHFNASRRQHHQHQLRRVDDRAAEHRRLHRDQSLGGRHLLGAVKGTGAAQDPRQHRQSRHDRHRRRRLRRPRRGRHAQLDRIRPPRSAGSARSRRSRPRWPSSRRTTLPTSPAKRCT